MGTSSSTYRLKPSYHGLNITADNLATKGGAGVLRGIFVSAASATPTIKVYDNAAKSGTVLIDTFTPVAATFYPFDAFFQNDLTVAIGGTVSCTVLYA